MAPWPRAPGFERALGPEKKQPGGKARLLSKVARAE